MKKCYQYFEKLFADDSCKLHLKLRGKVESQ